MFVPTPDQKKAVDIGIRKYKHGAKKFVLSGVAGSGKSTTVAYFIQRLIEETDITEKDICYSAFTGAAAKILQKKGNTPAFTLHHLLFTPVIQEDGTYRFFEKQELEYKVVVIDEISMATKKMLFTAMRLAKFVIMMGDPFQLPTINERDRHDFLDIDKVDYNLTEILRQKEGNGIIELANMVRNQDPKWKGFQSDETKCLPQDKLSIGMLKWADIVLCATNKTRMTINNKIREEILGYTEPLVEGEKVINLHNEWNIIGDKGTPLTNSTIGYLTRIGRGMSDLPSEVCKNIPVIHAWFVDEDGEEYGWIEIEEESLYTGTPVLDNKVRGRLTKILQQTDRPFIIPASMAYSYCITVHKAQGNEFNKVVHIKERWPFKEEGYRHLYTGITRAKTKCVVIR